MRFLELRPDGTREGFSLHPRMTVLRGLQPFARVEIVGLVHSVAMGESVDWTGRAEVHGVRMDIGAALALMGETAPAALVIDAGTLDGAAAHRHAELAATRAALECEIEELAAEIRSADTLRDDIQARVASATARIDGDAASRLDRADGELRRSARDADRPDPWSGMDDGDERVAALETLAAELDARLDALPTGDRAALAAAAATARASIVRGEVQAPRAAALAELWSSLHQRLVGLESRIEAGGRGTETLAAQLDEARRRVAETEAAATPRPITSEESARFSELHDQVLDLEARAARKVRRGAARDRLREAQQALNEALEPLGFPTWSAFRMSNGMAAVAPEAVEEHEQAQADLAEAEREWAELMTRLERDPELQEVLEAIDRVHREAVELIGSDPLARSDDRTTLAAALQDVVLDAEEVAVEPDDALVHLRGVLDDCGAVGHAEILSPLGVVALADSWLDVLDVADAAAVRVLRDRERAADEVNALRTPGDSSRFERLDDACRAVRALEVEVAESRAALLERADARLELHVLAVTALRLAQTHDELLEKLEVARTLEDGADRRVPDGERSLRDQPLHQRVPRGLGGPVPVVVAMGDADTTVLDCLLDLPDDVQLLVLGDPAGLADWVAVTGSERVAVVDAGALV